MNGFIVTITAELHKAYIQPKPPTEQEVIADAEADGLENVEVVSISEIKQERMN